MWETNIPKLKKTQEDNYIFSAKMKLSFSKTKLSQSKNRGYNYPQLPTITHSYGFCRSYAQLSIMIHFFLLYYPLGLPDSQIELSKFSPLGCAPHPFNKRFADAGIRKRLRESVGIPVVHPYPEAEGMPTVGPGGSWVNLDGFHWMISLDVLLLQFRPFPSYTLFFFVFVTNSLRLVCVSVWLRRYLRRKNFRGVVRVNQWLCLQNTLEQRPLTPNRIRYVSI